MFRKRVQTVLTALVGCLILATVAVQANDQFVGAWSGSWEGAGSGGRFDITLTKTGAALGGKVDVGQDTGDYSATFSTAAIEGGKFTARYDYPPEPQAEIVLEGTFEASKATGTWTMVQKGSSESFAAGSWTVTKK
jgi:hypothetical protein